MYYLRAINPVGDPDVDYMVVVEQGKLAASLSGAEQAHGANTMSFAGVTRELEIARHVIGPDGVAIGPKMTRLPLVIVCGGAANSDCAVFNGKSFTYNVLDGVHEFGISQTRQPRDFTNVRSTTVTSGSESGGFNATNPARSKAGIASSASRDSSDSDTFSDEGSELTTEDVAALEIFFRYRMDTDSVHTFANRTAV